MESLIYYLRRVVLRPRERVQNDSDLLSRFVAERDEPAFEALLHRHAPMVAGVCRRILGNAHDAEDAFQATFFVLALRAASIKPRARVGNWLYGVAYKTATRAKLLGARRLARERKVARTEAVEDKATQGLKSLLDDELSRLPEKYRVAIVTCDLEGATRAEAARQLGWAEGTLSGRLARGRAMLAKRLGGRGIHLPATTLAAMMATDEAAAGVLASLGASTVKTAMLMAAGDVAGAASTVPKAAALTAGALQAMFLTKIKMTAATLLAIAAVCIGTSALTYQGSQQAPREKPGDSQPAGGKPVNHSKPAGTTKAATRNQDQPDENEVLEGIWTVVSTGTDKRASNMHTFAFSVRESKDGNFLAFNGVERRGEIKLDASKRPKAIDFIEKGGVSRGIYSLEKGFLKLCYAARGMPRPKEFTSKPGSGQSAYTLAWGKPTDKAVQRAVLFIVEATLKDLAGEDTGCTKQVYGALREARKNLKEGE